MTGAGGFTTAPLGRPLSMISAQASDGTNRPWRVKMRAPSFMAIQALPAVVKGGLIADVVAVIGSTDVVMGDCDR